MATIQVADKPTLNEVLTKVTAIQSSMRYTEAVYKNNSAKLVPSMDPASPSSAEMLSVSSQNGGEFMPFTIDHDIDNVNYRKGYYKVTIDGAASFDIQRNDPIKYTPIKFSKSLKIEAKLYATITAATGEVTFSFSGLLYM